MTVINIDCIEGARMFHDGAFDAIVCDPPYELGFMGKSWDASGIAYSVEMWREMLRVLKPGGHLLAFSGSRTYHRMTCAIEDAGFEVRDQIMWVYGSGFPKSLDVSKAIDKAAGAEREVIGTRKSEGGRTSQANTEGIDPKALIDITAPATDAARQWEGWGTALKPAHEPICVARKPLVGTVAANVLQFGTGALNIDGCRVGWPDGVAPEIGTPGWGGPAKKLTAVPGQEGATVERAQPSQLGRWPANLIHDGSGEVRAAFPDAAGQQGVAKTDGTPMGNAVYGAMNQGTKNPVPRVEDDKSAARFFYCAKASKTDRNEGLEHRIAQKVGDGTPVAADNAYQRGATDRLNTHPTVKPTDLMRYLCRLVTPPGGMILDPFAGSGSTGKAAKLEGFQFIGFELSAEYAEIANARIDAV